MDKREIKGITLKSRLDFITANFGEGGMGKMMPHLQGELGELVADPKRIRATAWYDFGHQTQMDRAIMEHLAMGDEGVYRRMGGWSAEFQERVSTVKQFSDPWRFLNLHTTVFPRFYRPGRMELVKISDREARMRLHGFTSTRENCETNMGFIAKGIEMAGAADVTITELQCSRDKVSPYCEYRIKWV